MQVRLRSERCTGGLEMRAVDLRLMWGKSLAGESVVTWINYTTICTTGFSTTPCQKNFNRTLLEKNKSNLDFKISTGPMTLLKNVNRDHDRVSKLFKTQPHFDFHYSIVITLWLINRKTGTQISPFSDVNISRL